MATAFAEEAVRIRNVGGLSDQQIGRAAGAAPSTVRDWLSRRSSPTGRRAERVAELAEVVDRLSKPIEALGDRMPLDRVAQGDARRVLRAISEIESPGVVEPGPMDLDVSPVDVAGDWLRHVPHGVDPLHGPKPAGDNRWQRGRIVDALSLADGESTLWAEWYRHLAEHGVPPPQQMPRDVWRVSVSDRRVADLRSAQQLRDVGLSVPSPGRRTWPSFQGSGRRSGGPAGRGCRRRSAARPEGSVLCLIVEHGRLPSVTARRPPRTTNEPPAPPPGMRT